MVVRSPAKLTIADTGLSNSKKNNQSTKPVTENKKTVPKTPAVQIRSSDCQSSAPMRPGLNSSESPQLRKLSQYEKVCGSGIINQLSFFVAMPTTAGEASEYARNVAAQLREFATYGIAPLVFLEPTTASGLVDMKAFRAGNYDTVLDAYFSALKSAQITDQMMGTWVSFPEGNIPVWTSVDPGDFVASVTKTVTFQKKYFPSSRASIMLDTLSYPSAANWNDGKAVSLLPYVSGIPGGLIDSFGLQGFPWTPAANETGSNNGAPKNYLRVSLAAEAARALNVKNIWLNTGTFGVKYANQSGRQVGVSSAQRLASLIETVAQAKTLQAGGFAVSMHLFAEDKSRVPEATDWSYWPSGQSGTSASTTAFKTFAHDLQAANIPLWLFDADE